MAEEETPEEDIIEALQRLDLDIEDTATIAEFRLALREELGGKLSEAQFQAFSRTQFDTMASLEDLAIRPVTFERYGYTETRYVITGSQGLFGWDSVLDYAESLGYLL